jgi:hypothetical protein
MPVRPWHLRTLLLKACFQPQNEHSKAQNDHHFSDLFCSIIHFNLATPFQFHAVSQVLKMADMDLNANRSGKNSDTAVPVISKKRSPHLRYALYQAAFIA